MRTSNFGQKQMPRAAAFGHSDLVLAPRYQLAREKGAFDLTAR
jgi:hypothetical protein